MNAMNEDNAWKPNLRLRSSAFQKQEIEFYVNFQKNFLKKLIIVFLPTNVTFRLVHPTFGLGTRSKGVGETSSSQNDKTSNDKTSFRRIGGGVRRVSVVISS